MPLTKGLTPHKVLSKILKTWKILLGKKIKIPQNRIPYDFSKVKFWCRTCLNTQKHFCRSLSMGGNLDLWWPLFGKLDV
jgi:hypothetical protein